MKTCKFTDKVIEELYANWISFYNARVDAINYIRAKKLEEWQSEAEEEAKRDRYPKFQVIEWYEGKLVHMTEWMNRGKQELDKSETKFESLYQKVKDAVFTEEDVGYLFIFDFYKSEVRKIPSDKPNVVSVRFAMYHWDYSYAPYKVENILFNAPEVKFTDWEEVE